MDNEKVITELILMIQQIDSSILAGVKALGGGNVAEHCFDLGQSHMMIQANFKELMREHDGFMELFKKSTDKLGSHLQAIMKLQEDSNKNPVAG